MLSDLEERYDSIVQTERGGCRILASRRVKKDRPRSGQVRVGFQRLPLLEHGVALTGAKHCSLRLPLVVDFFEPGEVAEPGVVIFVQLRVFDVVSHAKE